MVIKVSNIDKKTIGISGMITAGLILASMLIPGFFDAPKFYCEVESSIIDCPGGLSGGSSTRCYLNIDKSSWDYCRSGWIEVTDDRPIQENPVDVPDSTQGEKWLCGLDGCSAV